MTYRDNMPTERRSWRDFVPKNPADRKVKDMVDGLRTELQGEPMIAQAMGDLGIEHFTIQSFTSGSAAEFMNSDGEPKLITIPAGATMQQIKALIMPLNPVRYVQKPKQADLASTEAMAKLRDMVAKDASPMLTVGYTMPPSPTERFNIIDPRAKDTIDILARLERLERRLGL
jgi:hypothetical protein